MSQLPLLRQELHLRQGLTTERRNAASTLEISNRRIVAPTGFVLVAPVEDIVSAFAHLLLEPSYPKAKRRAMQTSNSLTRKRSRVELSVMMVVAITPLVEQSTRR